ncbi:MAG: ABC transporter ATP-binding protein [Phycisphaeraceae bacterium]|nr:ABC transporter ATP-binding protein [Phycisphaeraceae bacterium]
MQVVLDKARKVFDGEVEAVSPLDLTIAAGQFVALLGPSGCGKSTLLRMIAGLETCTEGRVQRTSRDGSDRVAFVFQDAHLLPWRTVLRNVTLPLELMGQSKAQRRDKAEAALRQVGLGDAIRRYPAQLSGGMRMRVSLARALVTDPSLLLLDEPFAALDEITRQELDDALRQLWLQRRCTVIFVTHSIGEAAFLAQRAVVFTRRPARVVDDYELELPEDRHADLRASAMFAHQTGRLLAALQRGGQPG